MRLPAQVCARNSSKPAAGHSQFIAPIGISIRGLRQPLPGNLELKRGNPLLFQESTVRQHLGHSDRSANLHVDLARFVCLALRRSMPRHPVLLGVGELILVPVAVLREPSP